MLCVYSNEVYNMSETVTEIHLGSVCMLTNICMSQSHCTTKHQTLQNSDKHPGPSFMAHLMPQLYGLCLHCNRMVVEDKSNRAPLSLLYNYQFTPPIRAEYMRCKCTFNFSVLIFFISTCPMNTCSYFEIYFHFLSHIHSL